jgi:putative transposase
MLSVVPPLSSFRSNHNVVWNCTYHVVFCPKYRRPVLREPIAARLKELIRQVADETQSDVVELEVLPDHVHLLCRVDPRLGIARFVRLVKGRSSRLLRQEFPELRRRLPTLWTNARSWSPSPSRSASTLVLTAGSSSTATTTPRSTCSHSPWGYTAVVPNPRKPLP